MVSLATPNRRDAINRPPDWRWKRAGEIIAQPGPLRRLKDADNVGDVITFRRRVDGARTARAYSAILESNRPLFDAWVIYTDESRGMRWEIEARILAREPYAEIARKVATSSDVVTAYEKYFFNVSDRLDSPGYITHQVFGKSAQAGLAERAHDLLWKMFGYWQGPCMLDAWIYEFNRPSRPETAEGVAACLAEDFKFMAGMKAAQTMRTMPVDWQTRTDILMTWCRLLEIEKAAGSAGGSGEVMLSNMRVFLEHVPWEKYEHGVVAANPVLQLEEEGVSVRACEYSLFAGGSIPDGFKQLVASAKFPEPKDEKQDSAEAQP